MKTTMSDRLTTIRARLLLGTSLATAVILVGAGLMLYFFVHASLFAEFDMALRSSADALAVLMEQNAEGVTLEPQAANLAEFARSMEPAKKLQIELAKLAKTFEAVGELQGQFQELSETFRAASRGNGSVGATVRN